MASNADQTVVCFSCTASFRLDERWWHWEECPMVRPAAYEEVEQPHPQPSRCLDCSAEVPEAELVWHVCPSWMPENLRAQHGFVGPSRAPDPTPPPPTPTEDVEMAPASPPRYWVPLHLRKELVSRDHRYARYLWNLESSYLYS